VHVNYYSIHPYYHYLSVHCQTHFSLDLSCWAFQQSPETKTDQKSTFWKFSGHFGVIGSLLVCIYYILTRQLLLSRASGGADGPDRIFVGGLPYYLSEEQIMDLLSSFG
jgi:hypothetical protein